MFRKRSRKLHKLEARMGGISFFGQMPLNTRAARAGAPGIAFGKQKVRRGRISEYGRGLHECRKVEEIYTLKRHKLNHKIQLASKKSGDTASNLFDSLERMLVSVAYHMWASSPSEARQWITHGHVKVNNEKVDRYSYMIRIGDVISLDNTMRKNPTLLKNKRNKAMYLPSYFQSLEDGNSCTLLRTPTAPTRDDKAYVISINFKSLIEFSNR